MKTFARNLGWLLTYGVMAAVTMLILLIGAVMIVTRMVEMQPVKIESTSSLISK
jgi:signal peptidase I